MARLPNVCQFVLHNNDARYFMLPAERKPSLHAHHYASAASLQSSLYLCVFPPEDFSLAGGEFEGLKEVDERLAHVNGEHEMLHKNLTDSKEKKKTMKQDIRGS